MRGLAVTTAERFPTAPEFPTVAEAGVPGFDVASWYGFFFPAKTPPEIVRKLQADTVAVLAEPAIRDRLEQLGVGIIGSTPEELAAQVRREAEDGARSSRPPASRKRSDMITRRRFTALATASALAPQVIARPALHRHKLGRTVS